MQPIWKRARFHGLLAAFLGAGAFLAVMGMTPGHAAARGKGYAPGLGDLMNASMQMHHIKLWLAGHGGNWPLASYELKELREAVEHIEAYVPKWNKLPVGAMAKQTLDPDFARLDQAIKAKSPAMFDAAYDKLTLSCNACHGATQQSEIRIITPIPQGGGTFADQDFTPAKNTP